MKKAPMALAASVVLVIVATTAVHSDDATNPSNMLSRFKAGQQVTANQSTSGGYTIHILNDVEVASLERATGAYRASKVIAVGRDCVVLESGELERTIAFHAIHEIIQRRETKPGVKNAEAQEQQVQTKERANRE